MMARLRGWLVLRLHRLPFVRRAGRLLLRGRVVRQPFHGGVICLDAVEQSWAWTGAIRLETWDRHIQDRLLELSRGCRTMVDVGSNVGAMALSVALRNPAIAIVCVEPNARAAELLRESIAANRLGDRMTVVEAVAGTADGTVSFEEGGSTTGHVVVAGAVARPSVDFARLIDREAERGACLVKLDVEGYEAVVLTALPRLLRRDRVQLVVELHASGFNGIGDPARCGALLTASGAVMTDPDGRPVTAIDGWTDGLTTRQIEARWPV